MMLRTRGPLHTKGVPFFGGLVLKLLDADLAGLICAGFGERCRAMWM